MIVLLKLGGSLITDKTKPQSFRQEVLRQVINDIKTISQKQPDIRWVIGHGSGSFGHVEANKHNTINGVSSSEQWLGFAKVSHIAAELSQLVWSEFIAHNLPVVRLQPSASMVASNKNIELMSVKPLELAINNGVIPLIHGDVAFDQSIGGTIISTESIFQFIVRYIEVDKVILLGEVDGVLDSKNEVIKTITPQSFDNFQANLSGSKGTDVTGGMLQKVSDMLELVSEQPQLQVIIANGRIRNILTKILLQQSSIGTQITN